MRSWLIRRARLGILERLRCAHRMLPVAPEQGLFNFRCHENCVEYVRTHPDRDLEVVETIYVDDGEPILHYVVRDRADDRHLEVTLGWRATTLEYYHVRALTEADHPNIHKEFQRSLDYWLHQYVGPFGRHVLRIGRIT